MIAINIAFRFWWWHRLPACGFYDTDGKHMPTILGVMLVMLGSLAGCKPESKNANSEGMPVISSPIQSALPAALAIDFLEIADALPGSEFHDGMESNLFTLPETTGGGLAVVDYDLDGRFDVICSGGGIPDAEAKQMRGKPGSVFRGVDAFRFVETTHNARVDMSQSYNSAVIAADFDNDGFIDFLVTGYESLQLFHNLGDGTFEKNSSLDEHVWSSSAAFFDIDNDGDLDLYVTHYADWSFEKNPVCPSHDDPAKRDYCGPKDFLGLKDALYENLGDGTFANRTDEWLPSVALRGLGVIAADLDDDRDMDLYVTNDVEPNLLYRNDGNHKLIEMGRRSGVSGDDSGRPEGSMGVAIGDFNLDGKFDLWVTNYQNEICALYRNNGKMNFAYASHSARIGTTDESSVGWGTAFSDLDLDGDEDIVIINGHLERYSNYHMQRPQVLENVDGKFFRLVPFESGYFKTPQAGRGLAMADFDHDGRLDFGVTRINAATAIVRNITKTRGSFLAVHLTGTQCNRDAIGAVARLKIGNQIYIRQIVGGGSYASTNDRTIHFGIPEKLASQHGQLTIAWPSGLDQVVEVAKWNEELTVIEGK
jgi:enediyne biosynthesis protein E4